jgi:hypothetical protein
MAIKEVPVSPEIFDEPPTVLRLKSPQCRVERIPLEEKECVKEVLEKWLVVAEKITNRLKENRNLGYSHFSHSKRENLFDQARIACQIMLRMLSEEEAREEKNVGIDPWDTIVVCRVENHLFAREGVSVESSEASRGDIKGIAFYDSETHKIAYIVTDPKNIEHNINPHQERGVGTMLIREIVRSSPERELYLTATTSSLLFYERMGFIHDSKYWEPDYGLYELYALKLPLKRVREITET